MAENPQAVIIPAWGPLWGECCNGKTQTAARRGKVGRKRMSVNPGQKRNDPPPPKRWRVAPQDAAPTTESTEGKAEASAHRTT